MTDLEPLPLLLEPEQLEPLLGRSDLLILDCSSAEHYARFHVPGAVHVLPQSLMCGIAPAPGRMPALADLSLLFSRLGLSPGKTVIAYDDEGGGWAGRLIWTLDMLGHRRYAYLNGGLHAWVNEGHPTESTPNSGTQISFIAGLDEKPRATAEQIAARLGDADFAVWDARSAEEYAGLRSGSRRAGHIPGAVNLDWLELMDRERNLRLLDPERLRDRLAGLGLTPDKQIVTHCQSHHRSGLTYLTMKILGYPRIQGYDGSWGEWGNRDDLPVEV